MTTLNRSLHPAPALPERVLQFGTGVLLRGLPDYLIDKANKQGLFNGSVVIVKSTDSSIDAFVKQDCRYTTVMQGIHKGQPVDKQIIITAISRVISAQDDWKSVLKVAQNPHLQVIISNTTEVGIQYVEESIFQTPPQSFPGKLTAFLYERFKNFGGSRSKGLVVIPTELVIDNGLKLRNIVEQLAKYNQLGRLFMKWLKYHVRFCNSVVDRIVPGKLDTEIHQELETRLGYTDSLLIMTEPYRLWAIEGDDRVKNILSFAGADEGVIIDEDITFYWERKLRILNGGHTISVSLGYLLGLQTVNECTTHPLMGRFIEEVTMQEIVPSLSGIEDEQAVRTFAADVLDRFRNPHLVHYLLTITQQGTSKMRTRNLLTIQRHIHQTGQTPQRMALGFAAYLLFMKAINVENGAYFGEITPSATGLGIITYPIQDDHAEYFYKRWQQVDRHDAISIRQFVYTVCADKALWETDLTTLTGFADAVAGYLIDLITLGTQATLEQQYLTT